MKIKHSVELDFDSVSELIRKSLMYDYEINSKPDKFDCSDDVIEPDHEFLRCLEVVIQYYCSCSQFEEWKKNR
jgi:hypothetical protein